MWATARYTFGLSEAEFWEMSPGMWSAMHNARLEELTIFDVMQARICANVKAAGFNKKGTKIRESTFRFFGGEKKEKSQPVKVLKAKWMAFVAAHNAKVSKK